MIKACVVRTMRQQEVDFSITRAAYPGPADYASDSAELGKGSGRGRIAAFLMTASGRGATFCI